VSQGRRAVAPEVKEAYLDWLKVPPSLREPRTKKAFAEQWGITDRTLLNWEQTKEFKEKLLEFKKGLGSRMYADLIGAAYEIAMEGPMPQRMPAIKLLLDHIDLGGEEEGSKTAISEEVAAAIKEILTRDGYQVVGE
jgi:hypothetical protein